MTAFGAFRKDVSCGSCQPNWKGHDLPTTLLISSKTGYVLHLALSQCDKNQEMAKGREELKKAKKSKKRPHWLQPNNRASFVPAESALAQDQQERTKAILLTKSAML